MIINKTTKLLKVIYKSQYTQHISSLLGKPVLVKNSTDETNNTATSHTENYSDEEIEVLSEDTVNTNNDTEIEKEETSSSAQTNSEVNSEMLRSAAETQPDEELVVLTTNDKAVF